jgi:hypothetical protein
MHFTLRTYSETIFHQENRGDETCNHTLPIILKIMYILLPTINSLNIDSHIFPKTKRLGALKKRTMSSGWKRNEGGMRRGRI